LTLDGSRGVLYVNGAAVATNGSMYLLPLDVAPQTNHLGRSKFAADPYFNGEFACFRAYGRALSPAEIVAPIPTISQPANGSSYWPGGVINFSGSAADFMNRPLGGSNLTWQINYILDGRTNTVFGPLTGITSGTFAIPTNATGSYAVVLTAKDNSNRQSTVVTTLAQANAPAEWSSYYPLKSDAADANGHYDGKLLGGASFVTDATRGSVLNLNGANQYVSFPPGLAGMKTFMAWVKWNGGAAWQRVYDFGEDTNRYTVLTPLGGAGRLRFNISVDSIPGEQVVDAPASFPINVWTHVAVVVNGTSAVLYTNGAPVATNLFANLLPSDLNATNIYFGKSQWPADPYFSGELSSVRIFSRPLTAGEIVGPQITLSQPAQGSTYHAGDTVDFSGSANDFYDASIAATGLTWQVNFINAGVTNIVLGPLSGVASGSFNIPANGAAATNGFYQILLSAVDTAGRRATSSASIFPAPTAANWASFYPFTSGAQDASNHFNGTLRNGASIVSDPVRGNVLNLASQNSQYVSLPAGVGAAETVSGWVKWNGGGSWQRIFDFGNSTSQFFFLTPADGANLPQCAITPSASIYNQVIESPAIFPVGQWFHVAVVMDGRQGILYLNGNAVAVNNSVNLLPSDIGSANCWFGRSEFSADPYFNGRLSALRLNSSALSLSQIVAPQPVITEPAGGSLFAGGQPLNFAGAATDYAGSSLSSNAFSWTGEFYSNGVIYAAFGPLDGITNGTYIVPTNAATITNIFYRVHLTVTDTNGHQQTVSQDVLPQTSQLSLGTIPTGLQLSLDGQALSTPTTLTAVAGMSRLLSAPSSQNVSGGDQPFVIWSDGGAMAHDVLVPGTNATFTASYLQPGIGAAFGAGSLNLSWPEWAAAMKLYSATNLSPPIFWTPVAAEPSNSNGLFYLQLPAVNNTLFYRLQSP
ncbi:MAG TPA: LamG-like jellyroll fold domain-containing protein, partial [Candidatus Polarisedimenticolia bacterium]|nr:LamG-like jellyroll fold domain-containing protein [Candidatus Polarisedimenticolia bacterium]